MPTYRLVLEYDGTDFVGWQRQAVGTSVQDVLEQALRSVLGGEEVHVVGSGRTDSGVHALGQVASFRCVTERSGDALRMGLNSLLPAGVACREAQRMRDDFHAMWSARRKTYRYRILDQGERSPLRARYVWHMRTRLDVPAMARAAALVVGTHDFTSFRGGGSDAKTSVRTIFSLDVARWEDEVRVSIEGGGFLRHMVRILVGTLVDVGRRRLAPSAIGDILAAKDRARASRTAPAQGLCLVSVWYPEMEEDD